jgi:peroxiredoxin
MKVTLPSVTLLAFTAVVLSNFNSRPANPTADFNYPEGYAIGDVAQSFQLRNYDGRTIGLEDYPSAKGFIIVFTSNHCPYAEAYEDRLIALHRKFADRGFPLIAINPNAPEINPLDNMEAIKKRARLKRFPFPYLSDSLQQVFPMYGADRTPHVFVLDSLRHVRYMGTIDDNAEASHKVTKRYVEEAIHALMEGDEPSPSTTKTVGCKIRLMERRVSNNPKIIEKTEG